MSGIVLDAEEIAVKEVPIHNHSHCWAHQLIEMTYLPNVK